MSGMDIARHLKDQQNQLPDDEAGREEWCAIEEVRIGLICDTYDADMFMLGLSGIDREVSPCSSNN